MIDALFDKRTYSRMRSAYEGYNFNLDEQLLFIEQLESYRLATDIKVSHILTSLRKIYEDHYGKDSIQVKVCLDLFESVEKGEGLTARMHKWFHKDVVLVYASADAAGKSSESIGRIMEIMRNEREIKRQFISALKYPIFIILGAVALLVGVCCGLYPLASSILKDKLIVNLEIEIIQYLQYFFINFWYVIPSIIIVMYIYIRWLLKTAIGNQRQVLMSMPIIRMPFVVNREFENSKFLTLLSMMMSSELKEIECVKHLMKFASPQMKYHLRKIQIGINIGDDKQNYFGRGMLSEENMVALDMIFEQGAANFATALEGLASTIYKNAEITVKRMALGVKSGFFIVALVALGVAVGLGSSILGAMIVGIVRVTR